jgi:hypothetical protein
MANTLLTLMLFLGTCATAHGRASPPRMRGRCGGGVRAGAVVRGQLHALARCLWLLRGGAEELNMNTYLPVIAVGSELDFLYGEHTPTRARTDYVDTCTGSVESYPDACTHDETKCTYPEGCVVDGRTESPT